MNEKETIIFTDGASRGNPGPGGFGAVIISNQKVFELGGGEKNTTNNRMELTAAIESLEFISSHKLKTKDYKLTIYSDSNYLINGITKWIYSWEKRNWITKNKEPVLNKDLWEKLLELTKLRKAEWQYIAGHSGIAGNERADEIATAFADNKNPKLYYGSLQKHPYLATPLLKATGLLSRDTSKRKNGKARSYLSMIDGVIKTHKTWAECEKRVKGKSGAKFKKALSAEEEKEIIKSWGK